MLHIAIINECTVATDKSIRAMIPAFSEQWNKDLQSIWGVEAATFAFAPTDHVPVAGTWWVVFLDGIDPHTDGAKANLSRLVASGLWAA